MVLPHFSTRTGADYPRSLGHDPAARIRSIPVSQRTRQRLQPRMRSKITSTVLATNDAIGQWLEKNLDCGPIISNKFMGGSNWASTYVYTANNGKKYFVKTALSADGEGMFKGEALGLRAMYGFGRSGSFIVMEYLNFSSGLDQAELGRQLALMHLSEPKDPIARSGCFGFSVDNTIGATPQPNSWMDNWVDFFRERRLRHQLKLAGDARLSKLGEKLCDNLEKLFDGLEVKPSVLHGDLWSGNIAAVDGQPAIYDPATYYGHHEAEFGMSWCAGFNDSFYQSYHKLIPRAPGFEDRHQLYILYHYLNHYNLFGEGYYRQCQSILEKLTKKF